MTDLLPAEPPGDAGRPPWGWRFIDLADLGSNTPRSYVATLLRVILLPLVFLVLASVALAFADGGAAQSDDELSAAVIAMAVGAVIIAGLALVWGVLRSHRRPWMSLISPDLRLDWRRLAIGGGVHLVLTVFAIALGHWLTGEKWPTGSRLDAATLTVVLLLVPFQSASEEMLFRGYLTQALGRIIGNRVLIALAVGVLFGAVHGTAYGALTIPYLMLLSLILSLVSLRDDRLELAIGAHTANNWLAIGASDALGEATRGGRLAWPAIAILLLNGALFYGATRFLVERFCRTGPAP